jgi:hypothetical protein
VFDHNAVSENADGGETRSNMGVEGEQGNGFRKGDAVTVSNDLSEV